MKPLFVIALLCAVSAGLGGAGAGLSSPLRATAQKAHVAPTDPFRTWNEQALATVRSTKASDAVAARLYAMVNVAMYDAVNGIELRTGPKKEDRDVALVPSEGAPPNGNEYAAASAAAHRVLTSLFANDPALVARYDAQLERDLAAIGSGHKTTRGQQWGASVGAAVVAARANDGSAGTETQPPLGQVGHYRGSWNAQPRHLSPFAIANPQAYVSGGPPDLNSPEYKTDYDETKQLGDARIVNQSFSDIYTFWSAGSGTAQPPGEWLKIALVVDQGRDLSLQDATRQGALLGMTLADVVAPTFQSKWAYHFWRPRTAIQEGESDPNPGTAGDPTWEPRAGGSNASGTSPGGSSPEHTSGHSSFSAAAAEVLAGFFCNDDIAFSFVADAAPGGLARSYDSFSEAATEAGRSRVYGGLHFQFSNEAGLETGRSVADEILANSLLLQNGPTHDGSCPR